MVFRLKKPELCVHTKSLSQFTAIAMEEKKRRPRIHKPDSGFSLQERSKSNDESENQDENTETRKPWQDRNESGERKPWQDRNEGGERKPWQDRNQGGGGYERKPWQDRSEGGERKPWQDRNQSGERKPWQDRSEGGERKPWQDRNQGGERKPWQDRGEGGERKPWQDRNQGGERKPWQDRGEGGERKPWQDRNQGGGGGGYERKPWQDRGEGGERKPWQDRNQGGGGGGYERKPWQDRSEGGERKPWQDRNQGGGGGGYERKPWQDRGEGGERKPWQDRNQGGGGGGYERKPWQDRSQGGGGGYDRKPFNRGGGGGYGKKPFGKKPFRKKEEFYIEPQPKPSLPTGEGMPLNKYLAHCGISSRRKAVEFIEQGLVTVNGEVKNEPYYRIQAGDVVMCDGNQATVQERMVYVLLNKPKNVITTTEDDRGRNTVLDIVDPHFPERLFPVGRLDRDTTGLILITNDGDLAQKLSHPSNNVQKQYRVGLRRPLTQADFEHIERGVELEDGLMEVNWIRFSEDHPERDIVELEISSGRNRIVRRLFEHLGYEIFKLDRFYFAGLTKKELPRGSFRELTQREIIMLKHFTGQPKGKPVSMEEPEIEDATEETDEQG